MSHRDSDEVVVGGLAVVVEVAGNELRDGFPDVLFGEPPPQAASVSEMATVRIANPRQGAR